MPKNKWKYYEKWSETLHGFIAIGASTCVFNPNQGQGMSVAAGDAGILRQCLERTTSPLELPRLFFAKQAAFQRNAYKLACCNDLKFSTVQGERSLGTRLFNLYRDMITRAGAADPWVARNVAEVDLLLEPVSKIYAPWFMCRTLWAATALSWRQSPNYQERRAPQPPPAAELTTTWKSRLRESTGTCVRYLAYHLRLTD